MTSYHDYRESDDDLGGPLADWERELLGMARRSPDAHEKGYALMTVHRTDGTTFDLDNIRVESVGTRAEPNEGVIGAENLDGEIIHIPFVAYFTFEYRI